MSERIRFGSETNRQLFVDALEARDVECRTLGNDVWVDEYVAELPELIREFSGQLIEQDWVYEATGGGQDAGLQDTAHGSVRSNPPDQARGAVYPDYSKQIVNQGGFPPRRATWSQPLPVTVAGVNKEDRRR